MAAAEAIDSTQVLNVLRRHGGVVRAQHTESNLLKEFCTLLGLRRRGTAECAELWRTLMVLSARRLVDLTFVSDNSDDIVAVALSAPDAVHELARLRTELAEAHQLNAELRTTVQANAGDIVAVTELVGQAEVERDQALSKTRALQEQLEQLQASMAARIAAVHAGHSRAKDIRRIAQLEHRIERLLSEIERLTRRVKALEKVRPASVEVRKQPTEKQELGCGCVVKRISTVACTHGGMGHDFFVIAAPGYDPHAVAQVITDAMKRFTGRNATE